MKRFPTLPLAFLLAFASPALAQQAADTVPPEAGSGVEVKAAVHAKRQMVVAANPYAADAGLAMLRAGGSAADALIAVQTVLGLVEPQSSGLGGGGFLTWYDAASGSLTTFDARETAPAAATPQLFMAPDGKPMELLRCGGRRPLGRRARHSAPARDGAQALWQAALGSAFAPRHRALRKRFQRLGAHEHVDRPGSRPARPAAGGPRLFLRRRRRAAAGRHAARNQPYADTLKAIVAGGADAFYSGRIAEDIVAAVNGHPTNPGGLSLADLAAYQVKERPAGLRALSRPAGLRHGTALLRRAVDRPDPRHGRAVRHRDARPRRSRSWRIIGDATRLAFADRERYIADSDFVKIPKGLLDPAYLKARSELIRRPTALGKDDVKAGEPPWDKAELRRDQPALEMPSTSHIVIVDAAGNIASMTTSVENSFGSRLMVDGFILNNQLTDFAFDPGPPDAAVANRVEPGKRPRSSMAPTIVLKDGKPVYALGSPGGSNIISYVATTLIALIDWKMDMQAAVSLPHFVNRFGRYDLEQDTAAADLADDLAALGYEVKVTELNSGLNGIAITPAGSTGGTDPRREGVAVGD